MRQILKISNADFWLIFRDPSLKTFLFLPLLIFVVIIWALPALIKSFPIVGEYTKYIVLVSTIQLTQMFGFIYGMMLVDEKETGVAKVYGIIPVNKIRFILGRFIFPMAITILLTWLLLLVQPFYNLAVLSCLLFALLSGLLVPVYAITISLLSKTRIEALVWVKAINFLVVLPILAFFVPDGMKYFFGIFPTFWMYLGLEQLITDQYYWVSFFIGTFFLLLLIILCSRQFSNKHYE